MSDQLDVYQSIRKEWGFNPATRIKRKKKLKRPNKKDLMNEYQQELEEEFEDEE